MPLGKHLRHAAENTGKVKDRKKGQARVKWLDRVDVVNMLEELSVDNIERASIDEVKFSCPFSGHNHGDKDQSAYMNTGSKDPKKTSVFKCHGCGRAGNAITFLAEHEDISKMEATAHLREQYAPDFHKPRDGIRAEFERRLARRYAELHEPHETPVIAWERYEEMFGVNWHDAWEIYQSDDCPPAVAYLFDRGFTPDTLEAWRVGYNNDYGGTVHRDRIVVPVADPEGNLVGVKGRTWHPKGHPHAKIKYLIIGDKEDAKRKTFGWYPYEKALVIFGAHMIPSGTKRVVLVEGELDAIILWQIGIPAVCTGSAYLSDRQSKILRQICDEVVVFYDDDNAGLNATWGYEKDGEWKPGLVEGIEPFLRVRLVGHHERDAAKMVEDGDEDELRDLLDSAEPSYRVIPPESHRRAASTMIAPS